VLVLYLVTVVVIGYVGIVVEVNVGMLLAAAMRLRCYRCDPISPQLSGIGMVVGLVQISSCRWSAWQFTKLLKAVKELEYPPKCSRRHESRFRSCDRGAETLVGGTAIQIFVVDQGETQIAVAPMPLM